MRVIFNTNSYFMNARSVIQRAQKNTAQETKSNLNNVSFEGFFQKRAQKKNAIMEARNLAIEKKIHSDIKMISDRKGIPINSAEEKYGEVMKSCTIPLELNGNEKGLNKVIGYSLEKYQIIKDLLIPLQNVKNDENVKVPNGVLIYGPYHAGKTYFLEALGEHIENCGLGEVREFNYTPLIENKWERDFDNWRRIKKGDFEARIVDKDLIESFFEDAEKRYNQTGKRQILIFDDLHEIFDEKQSENVKNAFLFHARDCAKKGITWIGATNFPQSLPKMLYKSSRLDSSVFIGDMCNSEKSAVMSNAWKQGGNYDQTNHSAILQKYSSSDFHFYPPEVRDMVSYAHQFIDEWNRMAEYGEPIEDGSIDDSLALSSIHKYLDRQKSQLNRTLLTKPKEDIRYVENMISELNK